MISNSVAHYSFEFSFHSGLMNTSQSAKNSSQAPPPPPAQLNSTILQKYQNHLNQFPIKPIQHQPLINNNSKPFDAGKVNATVTHIELEHQSNCDITALLNMSCRGRAEAFARSLQSRLRTLGSQVSINLIFSIKTCN